MKQTIEIKTEVDIPEGYVWTGEYRRIEEGELGFGLGGETIIDASSSKVPPVKCLILQKVKPRVPEGERYYYLYAHGRVGTSIDRRGMSSDANYERGNYFLDEESAKEAAEKLEEFWKQFKTP